jgi:hypothetical protein
LLAALAAAAWWGASPAGAAGGSASVLVPFSGTLSAAAESVEFSGAAAVSSRLLEDRELGAPPAVVLTIDLSGVSGTGVLSRAKYVVSSEERVRRPLSATDVIDLTFPFVATGTSDGGLGMLSLSLTFSLSAGTITGGTAQLSSP